MENVSVIGLFRTGLEAADGQSIKTRIVTQEIETQLGAERVKKIDTYGWKKHPVRLMLSCVKAVWDSDDVVFMTDEGGINVFPWLLTIANVFKRCKIHYVVIGGWLIRTLDKRRLRRFWLKKLDGVYVETNTMKSVMESKGFTNVLLLPNCKHLTVLQEKDLTCCAEEPYRLCTFSRVMKEKGIQDAVEAVCDINHRFGRQVYSLDIYGQVDANQQEWFEVLKAGFPPEVRYCGTVPYHKSTDVLKSYFALLFPTKFYTEGVPGTIIDAYAAGVPVIASQWESFEDIMDAETCMGYPFDDPNGLMEALEAAAENPAILNDKKTACLARAKKYVPEVVMDILISRLNIKVNENSAKQQDCSSME